MTALGTKFIAALGAGGVAGVVAVIALAAGNGQVAGVALTLTVLSVLAAATLVKVDLFRTRRDLLQVGNDVSKLKKTLRKLPDTVSRQTSGRVVRGVRNDLRTRLADALDVQQARFVSAIGDDLEASQRRITADVIAAAAAETRQSLVQTQALYQLFARFKPRAAIRGDGPMPAELLGLLEVVRATGAEAVLGCDLGDGAVWLGYQLQESGGQAALLVADEPAAARQTSDLASHDLSDTVSPIVAPLVKVHVPHHYLPWHDVATLPEGRLIDLVLVGPMETGPRALLPVLPLLADRLAPGARLAVVAARTGDALSVFESWRDSHGAKVDEALSTDRITVLQAS